MTAKKCLFCGAAASLLCDSWIGWERKRGELAKEAPNLLTVPSYLVPIKYRTRHTCDAQLCSACAVPGGKFHATTSYGVFFDSYDYCPGHSRGNLRREISGLQAQAIRTEWKAQVRASQERAKPTNPQMGLFTGLMA
ncbi:hypothetical protein [Curvibacter lanceolatus]|uniref:hypothetical protein n=1 Tax=Curvibacter lanceolatus TaxID=86182 RepID=UPI0009FC2B21|nr:hypothetical protein [Curvibacter lanceolatus]